MAQYAVPADLAQFAGGTAVLAQLADDVNSPKDYSAANTQAMLNAVLTGASNEISPYVLGRLDLTEAQVLADLKEWTCVLAMYRLYRRRGNYGPANPFFEDRNGTLRTLGMVQDGLLVTGTTEQPQNEAWSSTEDGDPVYGRASVGGGGRDSSLLEGF